MPESSNPGDRLATAVEEFLASLGVQGHVSAHTPESRVLQTALYQYRNETEIVSADSEPAEDLDVGGTRNPQGIDPLASIDHPPVPGGTTPQMTIVVDSHALRDLAELIVAARDMRWNVSEGFQVGADVIVEHDSWIRVRRALRRLTNPEESR